jgi:hypothetical protein
LAELDDNAFPIRRYLAVAVLAVALLVGLTLLVRSLLFALAPPRTDANYVIGAAVSFGPTPVVMPVLLNDRHALLGEEPRGEHAAISVSAWAPTGLPLVVVNAWSPINDCPLSLGADRLVDCEGATWTFNGDPIDVADPPLQRFPTTLVDGAVVVDFTSPEGGPAS